MAKEQRESGAYTSDELVRVKDADGNVQPDPVPETWIGTDLLPAGSKKASAQEVKKADSGEGAENAPAESAEDTNTESDPDAAPDAGAGA